ncbi:hypothetical protein L3X38_043131 [Prunus dulcis]|uniref:SAUR-like auxin-responsive protein family n=1 Tax=Prunus dulcis TaxID=3755 RepID=A0AAD4UW64_PRUDU|nr:hypothetical protein L3X38_043131 [Prunus dulcis]
MSKVSRKTTPCDLLISHKPLPLIVAHLMPLRHSFHVTDEFSHPISSIYTQMIKFTSIKYLLAKHQNSLFPNSPLNSFSSSNTNLKTMGFWIPGIVNAKKSLNHSASSKALEIPKGHFEVYVGKNQKKRFVIPVSYLNEPLFLDLLNQAEEEFGYGHPMGCITMPCSEDSFVHLTSCLSV